MGCVANSKPSYPASLCEVFARSIVNLETLVVLRILFPQLQAQNRTRRGDPLSNLPLIRHQHFALLPHCVHNSYQFDDAER